jgi:hypothetical protein
MGLANAEDSEVRKPGSIAYRVLRIAHVAVVAYLALRRELRSTGPASRRAVNRSSNGRSRQSTESFIGLLESR